METKDIVPPGAQSIYTESINPLIMSINPNKIEIIRVDLKPLFNWRAEATGIAIIEDITSIPMMRMETDIVDATSIANI